MLAFSTKGGWHLLNASTYGMLVSRSLGRCRRDLALVSIPPFSKLPAQSQSKESLVLPATTKPFVSTGALPERNGVEEPRLFASNSLQSPVAFILQSPLPETARR